MGKPRASALCACPAVVPCLTARASRCQSAARSTPPRQSCAAVYTFDLTNALLTPPVTQRYLTCLYGDSKTSMAKRAGASLDVVRGAQGPRCMPGQHSLVRGRRLLSQRAPQPAAASLPMRCRLWRARRPLRRPRHRAPPRHPAPLRRCRRGRLPHLLPRCLVRPGLLASA